jgi:hypothetical protein
MTKTEFEAMLTEVLKNGIRISMFMVDNVLWYDMNTQMKSELLISYDELSGTVVYNARYGESGAISSLWDLVQKVEECECNRGFGNPDWFEFIRKFKGE